MDFHLRAPEAVSSIHESRCSVSCDQRSLFFWKFCCSHRLFHGDFKFENLGLDDKSSLQVLIGKIQSIAMAPKTSRRCNRDGCRDAISSRPSGDSCRVDPSGKAFQRGGSSVRPAASFPS